MFDKIKVLLVFLAVFFISSQVAVFAQQSSANYKTEEYYFGTGGDVEVTSDNYRAGVATGTLGVGTFSSANYDGQAGFLTQNQIFLEMVVTGGSLDLGVLSDSSASSGAIQAGGCSCSFTIRTYLSSTYSVYTMSQPPTSEAGAVLDAKSSLGAPSSDPNVEEFGINLVDNASPNIGANPSNQPDNSFADGQAATGYSTADQFKYGVGDIIARSQATATNPAIGQTNYTISYIAKSKTFTEAGLYTLRHDLVVVATY